MLALKVSSIDTVREIYQLAINLKSTCEGQPGPRANGDYFATYFRDMDGNKIAVFHRSEDENA
jgi:catechol-2,3-dioxygenase